MELVKDPYTLVFIRPKFGCARKMMLKSICGVFLILSVNISDALKPSGKHPLHISSHAKGLY